MKGIVGNLKNLIKALNNDLKLKVLFETWKFKLEKTCGFTYKDAYKTTLLFIVLKRLLTEIILN